MTKIWESKNYKDSNMFRFLTYVNKKHGLELKNYKSLHKWSIENLDDFWHSISLFFNIDFVSKPIKICDVKTPFYKTQWFKNSTLSYSSHLTRYAAQGNSAIIYKNELNKQITITWNSLLDRALAIKQELILGGVTKGDVVVGYLLNHPDTIAAFLATNSLGAIWSCCSPDFGIFQTIIVLI